MTTTPTGIPIIECAHCGLTHPANRIHCEQCRRPSLFLVDGLCNTCDGQGAA